MSTQQGASQQPTSLAELGIEACILHRIRAFCPTPKLLATVHEQIQSKRHTVAPEADFVDLGPRDSHSGFFTRLNVRPRALPNGQSSLSYAARPGPGFGSALSGGITVFAVTQKPSPDEVQVPGWHLLRVMRQGIAVHTVSQPVKCLKDLLECRDLRGAARDESQRFITDACHRFLHLEEEADRGFQTGSRKDKVIERIEDTSYTVTEFVFSSNDLCKVAELERPVELPSHCGTRGTSADDQDFLRRALPYLLARNYAPKGRDLSDMIKDVRPETLEPVVKICNRKMRTPNLSQSRRAFVALGPRGAIVAHSHESCGGTPCWPGETIVLSALNMLELLRGRHFNLIVAHTQADDAMRELSVAYHRATEREKELAGRGMRNRSEIVEKHRKQRHEELYGVHRKIVDVNRMYGLVVGDPGNHSLDGSSLRRMAELAEDCFNIRALRKNTSLKMEALERFYGIYESRLRHDSIDDYLDRLQNDLETTQLVNQRLG